MSLIRKTLVPFIAGLILAIILCAISYAVSFKKTDTPRNTDIGIVEPVYSDLAAIPSVVVGECITQLYLRSGCWNLTF